MDCLYTVNLVCTFVGGKRISWQPAKVASLGLSSLNRSKREIKENNFN